MEIITDTNIWVDFDQIGKVEWPFLIPDVLYIAADALEDEVTRPKHLAMQLQQLGLIAIDATIQEYEESALIQQSEPRLSYYDALALAIAKYRTLPLLTGDGRLRKTAVGQDVQVYGTLWILDQLDALRLVSEKELADAFLLLSRLNGGKVRLPGHEIEKRFTALINRLEAAGTPYQIESSALD